jgi:hypothetical protein
MGWAQSYIAKLKTGEAVSFRPRGGSMAGKIESGQLCTVVPIEDYALLRVGDIVLCKVAGNEYLHLIKAIQGERFQIGNNRGHINGWVGSASVFGKLSNELLSKPRLKTSNATKTRFESPFDFNKFHSAGQQ